LPVFKQESICQPVFCIPETNVFKLFKGVNKRSMSPFQNFLSLNFFQIL
jgi:hypothetical protein